MAETLEHSALRRWRARPVSFIEEVLVNPETGRPFELFAAERAFFERAWMTDSVGRLLYPELCFAAPKKTGKTLLAATSILTTTLILGGRFAEGYCVANDLEQAQGRVFQAVRRIVEASPLLRREAEITASRIAFPETGATIAAIGSDYTGAAGANPTISSFDELWGYTSERSRRLWDEMVPVPTRKTSCRLVTTYAGFSGESTLLEELHKRGLAQPQIDTDLYAGDGLLMFWTHSPVAPWQTEQWLAEMRRSLRPNQYLRMIENRFVTSEASFIDMSAWDACVIPNLTPAPTNRSLTLFVGVDASVKHDSTAIVATTWDHKAQACRLCFHRVFQPSPNEPLNFEATVERTLLELNERFCVMRCLFDPFQMLASAQRLAQRGLRIEEFPQTSANLTAASQNLYELIQSGNLIMYPDAAMRLAVSRAVAVETSRGWRISKDKATHKIDVIVALAQAALAAVQGQNEHSYGRMLGLAFGDKGEADTVSDAEAFYRTRLAAYVYSGGQVR
jgi:phage terminase large subunit-like protein